MRYMWFIPYYGIAPESINIVFFFIKKAHISDKIELPFKTQNRFVIIYIETHQRYDIAVFTKLH